MIKCKKCKRYTNEKEPTGKFRVYKTYTERIKGREVTKTDIVSETEVCTRCLN